MPKIIGQAEQQRAMKDIRAGLKELEAINEFLNADSGNHKFTITLTTPVGGRLSAVAYTEDKAEIDLLISKQRDRIVEKINTLAKNNRIEFDEQDQMILNNEPTHIEATPCEVTPSEVSLGDEAV